MTRRFAEGTEVSVESSRNELERLLRQHKATASAVFNSREQAAVAFEMAGRRILFKLALPAPDDREFTHSKEGVNNPSKPLAPAAAEARWEKACRRKWRALVLAIKAKLVSVDEGVETFEDAFMAHVVMPDGSTVSDHVRPKIADAYKSQKMVPLLPAPGPN